MDELLEASHRLRQYLPTFPIGVPLPAVRPDSGADAIYRICREILQFQSFLHCEVRCQIRVVVHRPLVRVVPTHFNRVVEQHRRNQFVFQIPKLVKLLQIQHLESEFDEELRVPDQSSDTLRHGAMILARSRCALNEKPLRD